MDRSWSEWEGSARGRPALVVAHVVARDQRGGNNIIGLLGFLPLSTPTPISTAFCAIAHGSWLAEASTRVSDLSVLDIGRPVHRGYDGLALELLGCEAGADGLRIVDREYCINLLEAGQGDRASRPCRLHASPCRPGRPTAP